MLTKVLLSSWDPMHEVLAPTQLTVNCKARGC